MGRIRYKTDLPIIAIGGIRENNITAVINSGADGIVVIGELMDEKDPEKHSRCLKSVLIEAYVVSAKSRYPAASDK